MSYSAPEQSWIDLRRDLHRNPELSGMESRTAARVVAALSPLDLRIQTGVGGHGVIADLVGDRPGPMLGYRADMDALPIEEGNQVPYQSCRPGVMHACGHDVHVAIGVGIAQTLAARRADLHGSVRFLFQPAEEAPPRPDESIGAQAMVEQGALEGVQAIFAVHCHPNLEVGRFSYGLGGAFAASDVFTIRLFGRIAHGAYPYLGIDAIHMSASVIQALLALPARSVDPRKPCALSLGTIEAGTAHNIIAGEALLRGSLRTFDPDVRRSVRASIQKLVEEIPLAFGGRGEVDIQESTPAVINHPELEQRAVAYLVSAVGPQRILGLPPQLGSEDFAKFSRIVPGCYLFVGVANQAKGIIHPIHTPHFDVDESCIPFAVEHLAGMLQHLLWTWSPLAA